MASHRAKVQFLPILRTKGYHISMLILSLVKLSLVLRGLEAVVDAFGSDVLHDDGTLNREALGAIVFHNEKKATIEWMYKGAYTKSNYGTKHLI